MKYLFASRLIIPLLFFFNTAAFADGVDCIDLLRVRDQVLLTQTQLGKPSWQDKSLNLRVYIVGDHAWKSRMRVTQTLESLKSTLQKVIPQFQKMGFDSPPLNLFVSMHPGAIRPLTVQGEEPFASVEVTEPQSPRYERTLGVFGSASIDEEGVTLYLGYTNRVKPMVDYPHIIAHEYAHVVQPLLQDNRNPKQMIYSAWFEARADFLAYLTTNTTRFMQPCTREQVKELGQFEYVWRDITDPAFSKTATRVYELGGGIHQKGVLLSNLLYQFEQAFGRERVIELLKKLDAAVLKPQEFLTLTQFDRRTQIYNRTENQSPSQDYDGPVAGIVTTIDRMRKFTLEMEATHALESLPVRQFIERLDDALWLPEEKAAALR